MEKSRCREGHSLCPSGPRVLSKTGRQLAGHTTAPQRDPTPWQASAPTLPPSVHPQDLSPPCPSSPSSRTPRLSRLHFPTQSTLPATRPTLAKPQPGPSSSVTDSSQVRLGSVPAGATRGRRTAWTGSLRPCPHACSALEHKEGVSLRLCDNRGHRAPRHPSSPRRAPRTEVQLTKATATEERESALLQKRTATSPAGAGTGSHHTVPHGAGVGLQPRL